MPEFSTTNASATILGAPTADGKARLVLTLWGSDLILGAEGDVISGTITDFTLNLRYDAEALGVTGPLEDQLLYEGSDVDYVLEDGSNTDLLLTSFVVIYGQIRSGTDSVVSVLGASDFSKVYGSEANVVEVSGEDVVLSLRGGDDVMRVLDGGGNVSVRLGAGNDTAIGGMGDDILFGGTGDDVMSGGAGSDVLQGGAGRDRLTSDAGGDWLFGGKGADVLRGGTGNDRMSGGAGRDVLIGGEGDVGRDVLIGGAGADAFVFVTNPWDEQSGRTTIRDFDASEDMLWTGPSNNGTWTAQEAFTYFMAGASQGNNRVVFQEGDYTVIIRNLALEDLSADNFVDGPSGGYFDWADLG